MIIFGSGSGFSGNSGSGTWGPDPGEKVNEKIQMHKKSFSRYGSV